MHPYATVARGQRVVQRLQDLRHREPRFQQAGRREDEIMSAGVFVAARALTVGCGRIKKEKSSSKQRVGLGQADSISGRCHWLTMRAFGGRAGATW